MIHYINKERKLYFDELRFGEALAITGLNKRNQSKIETEYLSDNAQKQLNELHYRINNLINKNGQQVLLDFRQKNYSSREIIENYFIYATNSVKTEDTCLAFYKAVLNTLPAFEEFCNILKDYIETQKKLTIN